MSSFKYVSIDFIAEQDHQKDTENHEMANFLNKLHEEWVDSEHVKLGSMIFSDFMLVVYVSLILGVKWLIFYYCWSFNKFVF